MTGYRVTRDPVVWGFAALALVVGILYIVLAPVPLAVGDQFDYSAAGHNILNWWLSFDPTLQRMPGYPILLALGYHAGLDNHGLQVVQAIALALCAVAVAALAADIGGRRSARVGAGVYAIYLPLLSFSSVLLTEAATIVLMLGATLCTVKAIRAPGPGWGWIVAAAAQLALGVLIRSDAVIFAVVLTAALLLSTPGWGRRIGMLAVVAAAVLLALGPWMGRNYALTRHAYPFGTSGRFPAAIGVHLPFDREVGKFASYRRSARFWEDRRPDGFNAKAAAQVKPREELWRDITHHPGEFAVTRAVGQAQMWVWPVNATIEYGRDDGVPYTPFMVLHLAILAAALVGFVRWRRNLVVRITLAATLLVAALHLITFPQPRYVLPVLPLLIATGAPVLVAAWRSATAAVSARRGRRRAGGARTPATGT
jgi:4-amino-4-deoxy-L-arabinose transferase-like glycosyltransferase